MLVAAASAGALQEIKPNETVDGVYVRSDGARVEIVGVCSISPDKVGCWDGAGARSPALEQQVRAYCLEISPVGVPFRFGRKNRFVIVREDPNNCIRYIKPAPDRFFTSFPLDTQDASHVIAEGIATLPNEKSSSLLIGIATPPLVVELPFRRGAKAVLSSCLIGIGGWSRRKAPLRQYATVDDLTRRPLPGCYWSIPLSREHPKVGAGRIWFTAFDTDHKAILYVDLTGEPVAKLDYQSAAMAPDSRGGYADRGEGVPVRDSRGSLVTRYLGAVSTVLEGAKPHDMRMLTNIDPRRIAFLQVAKEDVRYVLFKDIPLDPKD